MTVNPLGYVPVTDGGAPRIITGYAKEYISGGQFVGGSTAAGVVSSGTDSFVSSDIEFFHTGGSGNFIGIALADAASGAPLAAATRGSFLLPVSGTTTATIGGTVVVAGWLVGCNNNSEVISIGSTELGYSAAINQIGRAWTTGSTGEYVVCDIHG